MSDPNLYDYIRLHSAPLMLGALAYGNAKRSKTGIEDFHVMNSGWYDSIDQITYFRPYFRTVTGHDHTMFVFDVDTEVSESMKLLYTDDELREIKLRAVLEEFDDPKWQSFFTYISGQGLYMVQKYPKQVNKIIFEPVVFGEDWSLFIRCTGDGRHNVSASCDGWHNRTQELVKIKMVHGEPIHIKIDKRMFNHEGGRLFRGVYSPYFKIIGSTFFCVPVVWNDGRIDADQTLFNSRPENFRNPQPISIPPFAYEDNIREELDDSADNPLNKNSRRYVPSKDGMNYLLRIPQPHEPLDKEQDLLLDGMMTLISSDITLTPPCIKNSFEQRFNRFWSRVMLTRYLANSGYTPDEVGLFIRFRVNDEVDNKPENASKLMKYVKTFYGSPSDPIPMTSCAKLQDEKHNHYSCTPEDAIECRRTYPMQDYPIKFNVMKSDIEKEGGWDQWVKNEDNTELDEVDAKEQKKNFSRITDLATQIFKSRENLEIIKTTRAGVTTSLINQVAVTGRKMICVSPTNRIGEETFRDAMKIAHQVYGVDITGAILSANTKSCLKLRFQIKDLEHRKREEPDWGDYGIKYNDLAFHFKPSCISEKDGEYIECEYYERRFPNPFKSDKNIPLPVIASEITMYEPDGEREGICAYTSVVQELTSYDILFITYDKLNSILMNDRSDDAELIRNTLLADFDVMFLDEISQLAQHSPLQFKIISKEVSEEGGEVLNYTFFDDLYDEYDRLIQYSPHETSQLMGEYIDLFIDTFKPMVEELFILNEYDGKPFSIRHENPIPPERKEKYDEMFTPFYSMIENYAKHNNIHLSLIEKTILLLKSEFWWFVNVPTNEFSINASFVSSPKIVNIRSFIRDFDSFPEKQVLVTDATMPLIKISDLLGVKFKRFLVGDPRNTQQYQLVISDTKSVSSKRLLSGVKSKDFNQLIKFINKVCDIHNPSDVMIVLPNSGRIYRHMMQQISRKKIPKVQLTYYRSDITVGVSSDKRVMIAICPPYPPNGSYQWLAQYYHEWKLFRDVSVGDLSSKLEKMNAYQTFYQTIGRVKSPDNSTRSVVYAWGINSETLKTLMQMDNDVPLPHIISINHRGGDIKYLPVVGMFWKQYGIVANPDIIKIMEFLKKNRERKFTVKDVIKKIFRKYNSRKKKELLFNVGDIPMDVLEKYGIYLQITPKGKLYIHSK